MSRIGKSPVAIPEGVTVRVEGPGTVRVAGPVGELTWTAPEGIGVAVEEGCIRVTRSDESRQSRSLHGLARSLIANMVEGVRTGFKKALDIHGVGFRASVEGRVLSMALGFSAPVRFPLPEGVTVELPDATTVVVSGADKQLVGDTAARIRSFFPVEPYKGKGVQYKGERVRRKVGKTVA